MASNVVRLNVYQINNIVLDRDAPRAIGFPTTGCLLYDVSASPTRSLPSGYNVYGLVQVPSGAAADSSGIDYYVGETLAQLVTIFNT